jgi:hypothetical protein
MTELAHEILRFALNDRVALGEKAGGDVDIAPYEDERHAIVNS